MYVLIGEWIQATSRKDKKKQVKKDDPKENQDSPKKAQTSNKEEFSPERNDESVLKEAQVHPVEIQNQTTQTTPKPTPEKKGKKAKDVSTTTSSSGPSSQEPSPVKQKKQDAKPEKKIPEVVIVNGDAEPAKPSPEASPVKKQSISEDTPQESEPKGRVAFDEMGGKRIYWHYWHFVISIKKIRWKDNAWSNYNGWIFGNFFIDQSVDAWEEAKSRGNKKRRARKD